MIYLVWAPPTTRVKDIAAWLGVQAYYIHYFKLYKPVYALPKYLLQAAQTAWVLLRRRPRAVIVQNPPIFAPLLVWLYSRFSRAIYVLDSHSGAFNSPKWRWSLSRLGFIYRHAALTVVHNEQMRQQVEKEWGLACLSLANLPPRESMPPSGSLPPRPVDQPRTIFVVNSFSDDEPLTEVFQAAGELPEVNFHVSGAVSSADPGLLKAAPPNLRFTGFLPSADYFRELAWADAVMCLTTREDTMQMGAWEAMYLGRPLVLSATRALQQYFYQGAVFAENHAAGIAAAVRRFYQERARLEQDILSLRQDKSQQAQAELTELAQAIARGLSSPQLQETPS